MKVCVALFAISVVGPAVVCAGQPSSTLRVDSTGTYICPSVDRAHRPSAGGGLSQHRRVTREHLNGQSGK